MAGIVLLSGWVLPAMIVHGLFDRSNGIVGSAVMLAVERPLAAVQTQESSRAAHS